MRLLPREAWHYAFLMVILLALAALAVHHTLSYVIGLAPIEAQPVASIAIWSMTLGFMLIAGAFGIWAIQFSAHAESMRRIGQLVDAMDYIEDGVLSVNRRGRITGSNPAARNMAGKSTFEQSSLQAAFPVLKAEHIDALLDREEPYELERTQMRRGEPVTLRFRSQPCGNISLILISDVTLIHARRRHTRHIARLQLIGQLARGVAHDFNNILCVIAGHATLLPRFPSDSETARESIDSINRAVERGTGLANQLTALGTSDVMARTNTNVAEHVVSAAEMLRNTLTADWSVDHQVDENAPVLAMTGLQIEQIVVNLGLLAADTAPHAHGALKIRLAPPTETEAEVGETDHAAVLLISASESDIPAADELTSRDTGDRAGAILSIVRSMVEEEGGCMQHFKGSDGGAIFKVFCPPGSLTPEDKDAYGIPPELATYVAQWSVLLGVAGRTGAKLSRLLDKLSIRGERVSDIAAVLARIEERGDLDVIVVDQHILRHEVKGLLRAIRKLRPTAGIVVLLEQPQTVTADFPADIVTIPARSGSEALLSAMVRAKSLLRQPG